MSILQESQKVNKYVLPEPELKPPLMQKKSNVKRLVEYKWNNSLLIASKPSIIALNLIGSRQNSLGK